MTPEPWEPPTLREMTWPASRVHVIRQLWLTMFMCCLITGIVTAQATSGGDGRPGWLDQLTAPTTLLALATVIYHIGMTRQRIQDLEDRYRSVDKFMTETVPNTYIRKDNARIVLASDTSK